MVMIIIRVKALSTHLCAREILWKSFLDTFDGFFCENKYQPTLFFFFSFIRNTKLKLTKNQAIAKQHPEPEFLTIANYPHSSSTLSSKNNRTYSKNKQKNKYVCMHGITPLIIIKMKLNGKSHRYNINRTRSRDRPKYTKY